VPGYLALGSYVLPGQFVHFTHEVIRIPTISPETKDPQNPAMMNHAPINVPSQVLWLPVVRLACLGMAGRTWPTRVQGWR
jgi:hypothetical protein